MNDWELIALSRALKLVFWFVALEGALRIGRRFLKRNGTNWKREIAPLFERDPVGAGLFYGLVGSALVIGSSLLLA